MQYVSVPSVVFLIDVHLGYFHTACLVGNLSFVLCPFGMSSKRHLVLPHFFEKEKVFRPYSFDILSVSTILSGSWISTIQIAVRNQYSSSCYHQFGVTLNSNHK